MNEKAAYLALRACVAGKFDQGGMPRIFHQGVGHGEQMLSYATAQGWYMGRVGITARYTPCGWDDISPAIWDQLSLNLMYYFTAGL